jgi:hypothetical protein
MKLRAGDERELRASTGLAPVDALLLALDFPGEMTGTFLGSKLIMVNGCGEVNASTGSPWCVGTEDMDRYFSKLYGFGLSEFRRYEKRYPILMNFVAEFQERHIRWLKSIGFEFPDQSIVLNGERFLMFRKEKVNVLRIPALHHGGHNDGAVLHRKPSGE